MRTTIDLPTDLHTLTRQLAHESHRSMSDVVADLIRQGLRRDRAEAVRRSTRGMPLVALGRPVTAEDVRSLDDE